MECFTGNNGYIGSTSQAALILAYLSEGNTLTPLDALIKFKCLRLGARILELRQAGYRIATDWKTLNGGKRVAQYRMEAR
jgi:hypothetical protein